MQSGILIGTLRPELLKEETLADIFRSSANTYPDVIALQNDSKSLTYAQLDAWSNAMAYVLTTNGVKAGDNVGVWWPRGLELHVIILAIVKCGAAYVPLDREMPEERVRIVLSEVGAVAYISDSDIDLPIPRFEIVPQSSSNHQTLNIVGPLRDDRAYVLYTSGSTGRPKGIPITHRQICHFVRAEHSVLGILQSDKVYQGFSVSFDMWCEEVWISYLVGATLWVADATTAKAIDELSDLLRRNNITVLHAVPSLLAVIDNDVPSIRLVNAGGEACTAHVLERWSAPPRLFFNTYGPTETTVTATIARLQPGDTITIGNPLPNYGLAVVDESLALVPAGTRGELIISGPGVCNGYINRPDLSADKFLDKPIWLADMPGNRIYRTGDAAVINPDGSIDFQGRFDDQVKLRGYRIELGEIENRISELQDVIAAAVAIKKDINGQEHLAGYVVCDDPVNMNQEEIRAQLAKVLPPYMVPAVIVQLKEMPRLPSGKIDRKSLPVPAMLLENTGPLIDEVIDIDQSIEHRLLAVLRRFFPNRHITLDNDFFNDLGGHSLLAAAVVSKLRKDANIPQASLKDLYMHRPLSAVAEYWNTKPVTEIKPKRIFRSVKPVNFYLCWLGQTFSLLFMYALFAVQIFFPYLAYYIVKEEYDNVPYALGAAFSLYLLIPPFFATLIVLLKWLVIGKIKEGDYPLWGGYYFRWWFVNRMQELFPSQFLNGTPLYNGYLRSLGVTISKDAQLGSLTIGAEDLVTIGKDVSISSQVVLNNAWVEDGYLKLRRITIADHAYIGSSAVVSGGATIEAWGELQDLSHLQEGKTINEGEIWQGSPAVFKSSRKPEEYPQPLNVSSAKRVAYSMVFAFCLLLFPITVLGPLLPIVIVIHNLDNSTPAYDFSYLTVTPSLALTYIVLFALTTIGISRLLLVGLRPGVYPIYSGLYVRKWFADQLMSLSLIVLHPVFATVYVSLWFRALGAKVGTNTEISTASSVTHPLLEIGKDAFVADAVTLGEADVRGQRLILEQTIIADNSFVGNSGLIPQGYTLNERMLIGVLSTPPNTEQMAASEAKDWFGSPAIPLPRRQESRTFPATMTTRPTPPRLLGRSVVEFARIILPETVIIICSILFIAYADNLVVDKDWWVAALELPFYYLFFMGAPALLVTVLLKWLLVGKYKPIQSPMWTARVWFSEAITSTYESLAVPFMLQFMKGTPWLPICLRLFGVKIGSRVWLNTTDITEHDMVEIGDDSALNEDCGPQTHLFEDRVMKIGPVKIGARCSIGARTIVLYDSEMGNDVKVDALSLVMKGENLQHQSDWTGSPIRPA